MIIELSIYLVVVCEERHQTRFLRQDWIGAQFKDELITLHSVSFH